MIDHADKKKWQRAVKEGNLEPLIWTVIFATFIAYCVVISI